MIDFSRADRQNYEGTKEATLTGAKYNPRSKNSGKPVVEFKWTLSEPDVEGATVLASKSLQPQAIWSTKAWLVAMGADSDRLAAPMSPEELQEILDDLLGSSCRLVLSIGHDYVDDKGQQRDTQRVDDVLSLYVIV